MIDETPPRPDDDGAPTGPDVDIPTDERISAMTSAEYREYEHRVRLLARRHGLELQRSRGPDPRAPDRGKYTLIRVEERRGGTWRRRRLFAYERGRALREIHRLLIEHYNAG